jgi:hypothetical protein
MKIHSDVIKYSDLVQAVHARGMVGVKLADCETKGSRSRKRSFDIRLTGNSASRPNFGAGNGDEHAAQWDEWGIFIDTLFTLDPEAIIGVYKTYAAFKEATCGRFDTLTGPETHRRHRWDFVYPYHFECSCGAEMDTEAARHAKVVVTD